MNHFKELRIQNGYATQAALAKVLFVNQTAVSQWEREITTPSPTILLRLSKMYGVTTDYLLGNETHAEKTATPKDGGPREEFGRIFDSLTQDQQEFVIAAMRGMQREK